MNPTIEHRDIKVIECYNVDTGERIGCSSVKPEPGQEHYFGEQLYTCISCGDIAIFAPFADWNHD